MSMQMEFILESPQDFYSECTSDDSEDDIPNDQPCDDLLDQYFCDDEEVMSSDGESADFNVESDVLVLDAEMEAVFMGANPIAAIMNVYSDGDSNTQTVYHQENNAEGFSGYTSPFKSKAAFILHALFHGNKDLSSERSIKKIMFVMKKLLEACEEAGEKLDFPKPDAVINYHLRKKNEILVFLTTTCTAVNQKGQRHEFLINKLSEYLRHTLACPGKTAQMSSLPDFTENQWLNLNQGTKWKENPMFQISMITSEGLDYWVGSVVEVQGWSNWFLLEKFYTKNRSTYANAFQVYGGHGTMLSYCDDAYFWSCGGSTNFAVSLLKYTIEVDKILSIIQKDSNLFLRCGLSVSSCPSEIVYDTLVGIQSQLWLNTSFVERFKIRLPRGGLIKVVICPLNLYSDDTSRNSSKQYNKYNSYLMYFAAMPLEMLLPIVDDFVELEKGIVMYSKDHSEDVLVVASLLLFMGDNPWQSQLAMHSGTSGKYFCRKCHLEAPQSTQKDSTPEIPYLPVDHNGAEKRTKEFLNAFATANIDSELYKHGCNLNYSKNGSKEFLRLEAFDATKDFSKMSTAEMARLESALSSYRVCKSYSRGFRNQLCHNGLFVGCDYKQLMQVLPNVMTVLFSGNSKFELLTKTLYVVAKLLSLLYMCGISEGFDYYIVLIKHAVNEVTNLLLALDIHIKKSKHSKQDLTFKPKVHLLHHIAEDIVCFGSVLQYETENSKQFNKFGKQFICHYLCNGGYYNVMRDVNGTSQQVRCTAGKYIQELSASPEFRRHFFGSRPNSDNSGLLTPTLCNTLAGVFQANGQIFLGQVKAISTRDIMNNFVKKYYMQKYQMIPSNSIECIYTPPVITANVHNIVVVSFGHLLEIREEEVEVVQAIDIHLQHGNNSREKLLNVEKFGVFWWMLMNIAKIAY
ncbi:hypothetical protein F4703DRAFT_1950758 [Phycomyces blakesleeanus]